MPFSRSLSARRAWIEIAWTSSSRPTRPVALRKESVDRNVQGVAHADEEVLSLSARRAWIEMTTTSVKAPEPPVALRKESVDRNSRRPSGLMYASVALRKESVDRNIGRPPYSAMLVMSLSARRAWIEICGGVSARLLAVVALRKESVDRNTMRRDFKALGLRRSPQGERG